MSKKQMPLRLQKYMKEKTKFKSSEPRLETSSTQVKITTNAGLSPCADNSIALGFDAGQTDIELISKDAVYEEKDQRDIVLFIIQKNGFDVHEKTFCGIGIRGKLTSDILKLSSKYNFVPCFIDNIQTLNLHIKRFCPKIIIYNYHMTTTPWLNTDLQIIFPDIIHIFIHYDLTQKIISQTQSNKTFHHLITDDDTLVGNEYVFVVARSLPFYNHICKQHEEIDNKNDAIVPKIGFQGFGFPHKGIHRIAEQVCKEFDHAIIRLHIPFSLYGDPYGTQAFQRVDEVKRIIIGTNIQLEVSHEFKNDYEIIGWLKENDVNCYFYDYLDGAGIASSPDYAIAARTPIAITRSHQFRHMWNLSPSICIENNTLRNIIDNGIEPLKPLYEKYTHDNVIRDYNNICDKVNKKINNI